MNVDIKIEVSVVDEIFNMGMKIYVQN